MNRIVSPVPADDLLSPAGRQAGRVVEFQNRRILVAVGAEDDRTSLSDQLRDRGFAVTAAADGGEALARIAESAFDVVLLDARPGLDSALETLGRIRETCDADALPVILATDLDDGEGIERALDAGANDYVVKPIAFPRVLARIRNQVARKAATEAAGQAERRRTLAVAGSNDGIWDWDLVRDTVFFSERWCGILGIRTEETDAVPDFWLDRIHAEDRQTVLKDLRASLDGIANQLVSEHRIRHENGTYRWVLVRGMVARSVDGEPERIAGSMTDITDRKAIDRLTGLPNRAPLSERIDRTLARLRQYPDQTAGLFVINIDGVGTINEGYGELFGDMILKTVADRLTNTLRPTDVVASLGGDEFSVFLDRIEDPSDALRIARRIQEVIAETIEGEDRSINLTAGIGVAISAERHRRGSDMISEAFAALNRAKKVGKSGIALFDEQMQASAARRLDTERALRVAIDNGEIQLAYQPIVDLRTGSLAGFEGLARWLHPERGIVSPGEFIPVAEESGLIVPMTERLMELAVETARDWTRDYARGRAFYVSVNLSARNFETASLVQDTEDVLRRYRVPASVLNVEVTESQMMQDIDAARRTLEQFREAGIHIALDDFGTGHSSLAYLTRLPLDTLKIDRSFVEGADRVPDKRKILQAIVALGKSLDMAIVGEGIETAGEHAVVSGLGCDAGQGYLYARPTAAEDLTPILESWRIDLDFPENPADPASIGISSSTVR